MREVKLTKAAERQLSKYCVSFYEKDIETSVKSFVPGEWVTVSTQSLNYIGFINPNVNAGPVLRVIKEFDGTKGIESIISNLLKDAWKRRVRFERYENYRLCYGEADLLPGLIIDVFENYVLIQINTAGVDTHRVFIKKEIENIFKDKEVVLFDNENYRKNEVLPTFENVNVGNVEINESGFKYIIEGETIQKIGYYFDHRENRLKLERFLKELPELNSGVDLFSYVGSWGLHMLRGGVKNVEFVDQANMEDNIAKSLSLNKFDGRGSFIRKDVFSFLEQCLQKNKKFDIIVSDPPAFSKSEKNIKKALGGYEKLHFKSMSILNNEGYYVAASCTHGVSIEDLDLTVLKASKRLGKRVQLLDIGVQGWDHPFESLGSKAFYIKYLLYQVYK
ncbi:class I SAM-dependent rRNA methyltransferase [Halobacteriovorax sp.]|uniref:class I SAM-dependent rRNA methyltransferase n=1 Tax=Halobacteriovorax sp. TaxID=2020862 RepID=UPI0035682521